MKLLIASDLHGSAYYTEALLRRIAAEKPDRVLLLGDLLYHGPRNDLPREYDTKRSAALLNALSPAPLCVRGNCDAEVDQMVLSFPVMTEFAAVNADGVTLFMTHGHHLEEAAAQVSTGSVVLYGHTHLPDFTRRNGVLFVNPGSVSIPKGESTHSYLIFEDGVFTWKNVESGEVLRKEQAEA